MQPKAWPDWTPLIGEAHSGRLSSTSIRQALREGLIVIEPDLLPRAIQPGSIDIRIGETWIVNEPINWLEGLKSLVGLPAAYRKFSICSPSVTLNPGDFVLASTYEHIEIHPLIACQIGGNSTGGRQGLAIHITAGYVDPGWVGRLTLELKNEDKIPITLHAGERIGQLIFDWLDQAAEAPYGSAELGSRYWGDSIATQARPRPVDTIPPPADVPVAVRSDWERFEQRF